ncbi:MAG: hypothetical protein WB566_05675 [Terriglobales bacterium]
MKIIHRNSPKAGQVEHVRPDVGRVLVASGFAEACKLPAYGTKEWADDRAAMDANRPLGAGEVNGGLALGQTAWGVKDNGTSPYSKPSIVKRAGNETFFFDGPPADCPPIIVKEFNDLIALRDPWRIEVATEAKLKRELDAEKEAKRTSKGIADPDVTRYINGQLVK